MNVPRFVAEHGPAWDRLEELIGVARGRPERLGAEGVRELGRRYRSVVADLARARQAIPGDPVTRRLERLAVQGRQLVYDAERSQRHGVLMFFATTYWQLIRSRPIPLLVAVAFLVVPAVLAAIWSYLSPAEAVGLVPAEFRSVLNPGPEGTAGGMSAGDQTAFSAFLMTHNIQVSLVAFSLGIFWCLGTIYVLGTNGLLLGAIGGLLFQAGDGAFFVELVAAHGVLELTAVVVASAAGLRMGWALVDPGLRRRQDALVAEAKSAVLIVVGTMPWFVVAGLIEAFVSRNGFEATPMAVVGLVVGGAWWLLLMVRGRPDPATG
jgi:uncharacterized membrane protein SpoIIM required for sporulation